jgi:stage II sporulation protein D
VVTLPLEEYAVGAALAEVSVSSLPPEAAARVLEVQVLLARTYAVANPGRHAHEGFDLCATTHCQLYRAPAIWTARLRGLAVTAARRTEGRLIVHEGAPIQALYHSDCGGHTSAAADVWTGTSRPYLQPVADSFCRRPASQWEWRVRIRDLREALNDDPRFRVGAGFDRITIVGRDVAGRVGRVGLGKGGRVVLASALRAHVLQRFGARSLRSTLFSVERQGDWFVFKGQGNGHGAGLCQIGAIARAERGQSASDILRHYFRGVRVEQWPAGRRLVSTGSPRPNRTVPDAQSARR